MSSRCKVIFERGRYFIETGNTKSLRLILGNNKIFRYIPELILRRIENLIDNGDRESATALWMKACETADTTPKRLWMATVYFGLQLVVAGIALYSFIYILNK
jgi:hypothetical protein